MRHVPVVYALLALGLLTLLAGSTACRRKSNSDDRQQKPVRATDAEDDGTQTAAAANDVGSPVDAESSAGPATLAESPATTGASQAAWYEQPEIQLVSSSLLADASQLEIGSDAAGNLWLAVVDQTQGSPLPVRLVEFQVEKNQWFDRGQAPEVSQTAAAHGIYQAADQAIYLATLEHGHAEVGWTGNSYLWRVRPLEHSWEPILKTNRPLLSVCQAGPFVFALGSQHTVYQVHSSSAAVSDATIGSVDRHVSQRFIVDRRGHLFVPRVKQGLDPGDTVDGNAEDGARFRSELVELDEQRNEIQALPLDYYGRPAVGETAVGIVAVVHLVDGSIVFATDQGYLYRLIPVADVPTIVQKIGWLHPRGISQPASLVALESPHTVAGLTKYRDADSIRFDWVVYDVNRREASIYPVNDRRKLLQHDDLVLHSYQQAANHGCYLAGSYRKGNRRQAILLRIDSAAE